MISVSALILRLRREQSLARQRHSDNPTAVTAWMGQRDAEARLAGALDALRALEHDLQVELTAAISPSVVDEAQADDRQEAPTAAA